MCITTPPLRLSSPTKYIGQDEVGYDCGTAGACNAALLWDVQLATVYLFRLSASCHEPRFVAVRMCRKDGGLGNLDIHVFSWILIMNHQAN